MTRPIINIANTIIISIFISILLFSLVTFLLAIALPGVTAAAVIANNLSEILLWSVVTIVTAAYLLNVKRVSRSLHDFFNPDRVIILIFLVILTELFATHSESLVPNLTYLSPAWGWLGFILIVLLLLTLVAKLIISSKNDTIESDFQLDDPTDTHRPLTDTQEVIYERLRLVVERTADISIALTGNWGTGKTKILHNLQNSLPEETLWFTFYPWAYTSEEALIKDFYVQLTTAIDKKLPRLVRSSNSLTTSINRLIDGKVMGSLFSLLAGLTFDLSRITRDPEDVVAKRLHASGLKIIIVMDDLERVKDEAIINRSLQLVHHLKRRGIQGISFITAFERQAILEALPRHVKNEEKSNFIEKFFDMEIMLPDPLPDDLEKQLAEQIPEPLRPSYIRKALLKDLKSHRAIIRLANEYHLSDSLKKADIDLNSIVNMDDFLVLTHIKLKYPFIYRDISQNRHIYTQYDNGLDEESIAYQFMDESAQNEFKRKHIEQLFKDFGLPESSIKTVSSMLVSIFPDLSKALDETGARSNDFNTQRRERRIGLRMVLDAALGMFNEMAKMLNHEKIAKKVINTLESEYTEDNVQAVANEIVQHAVKVEGDSWDASLHILTSELSTQDELKDSIPLLAKCLIRAGLELDSDNDANGRKVRVLGQAFYIFTDNLLYRGYSDDKKRQFVESLSLLDLINFSRTPYGTVLLSKLELSREAQAVKARLDKNEIKTLRIKTRQHFESYYIEDGHDMVVETIELVDYLSKSWEESTRSYKKGLALFNSWKIKLQRLHPDYFLDMYTTKTYRGNWAFKEVDFGTVRPVQNVSSEKLKEILDLIAGIESSDNLSDEDLIRIKMVRQYAETH